MTLQRQRASGNSRILRIMMCAFTAAFLVAAFVSPDRSEMLGGLKRLVTQPSLWLKDAFMADLGCVSGALLNTALVGLVCCALTLLPEARINGGTVMAYFLTVGCSFFGINIVNMLPLMLGVAVFALIRRIPLGRVLNYFMFATALSPFITELLFRYPLADVRAITPLGIGLALLIGVLTGCLLPVLCQAFMNINKGYNLHNAGPAAGFLCMVFFTVLYKVFFADAPGTKVIVGDEHRLFVNLFCVAACALLTVGGLVLNGGLGDYLQLIRDSGHQVDFTSKYTIGANLMNMGVVGLGSLLYCNLIGASFNGTTMGMILCMMGGCCAGVTPLNVLPIVLGYVVMGLLNIAGATDWAMSNANLVIGLGFASGLAPIAGEYGIIAGGVAGILHYSLVSRMNYMHGGFDLYGCALASGIVCLVLLPILEYFFKTKDQRASGKRRARPSAKAAKRKPAAGTHKATAGKPAAKKPSQAPQKRAKAS